MSCTLQYNVYISSLGMRKKRAFMRREKANDKYQEENDTAVM